MKKTTLISILVLTAILSASAQNVDDALRYSRIFYNGTARFMSMGGAFTALGGDISCLSQNPAGLGVFRSSELTITPTLINSKSSSLFNGTKATDYQYDFGLGQAGIVANLMKNGDESGLVTLNLGYSFNKTNNLNMGVVINGTGTNSLTDYWTTIAKGYYKDELASNIPDAYLAWNTWLIDSLSGSNTQYGTVYSNYGDNLPSVYGQTIKRVISNTGYTGEHAISIGANYFNKLFVGATLGISTLQYESKYEHYETTDASLASGFSNFDYLLYYKDSGTGFSLKVGGIYKPIESLRIGFAFHSPTFYRINEYVYDNISTHFTDGNHYEASNDPTRFSYGLTTPFRVMAGAAYQVGKLALVSADYEFTDYGSAKFYETGDGYDYSSKNQEIKSSLGPSSNLRLGAEIRLSTLYLRGGYGYYGKSWRSGTGNENLRYDTYSFGFGFREQNISADFGFTTLGNKENYILYSYGTESAVSSINMSRNIFMVTFGYKFGY
jgi:hypothetical protein